MAPINVRNDRNHVIATVRTHGRSGWIEVNARRRWSTADARNVAAALVAAADAQDNAVPPPPTRATETGDLSWAVEPASSAPPRHGRGASRGAWAAFAAQRGIPVTADMGRDDIIAAYDDARQMAPAG